MVSERIDDSSYSPTMLVAHRPHEGGSGGDRLFERDIWVQTLIIRRPTPIDIVSATAARRDVFAMMPAGLAAVASSAMT